MASKSRSNSAVLMKSEKLYILSKSGSGDVLIFNIGFGNLSKRYDLENWKELHHLIEFCCISYNYYIYIIGGYCMKTKKCLSDVRKYNTITKEWFHMTSMKTERRLATGAIYGTDIYICGGIKSNDKMQSTTEIYSIPRNKWRKGPGFSRPRADMQLVRNDDCILAVGGLTISHLNNKSVVCSSDEILELQRGGNRGVAWSVLDDDEPIRMGKPAYQHSACVESGKLFIMGGIRTMQEHNEQLTERPNFEYSELFILNPKSLINEIDCREWISPWLRDLGGPIIPRYSASLISIGSRDLYLIGGTNSPIDNDIRNSVLTIEKYNIARSEWSIFMDIDNSNIDISSVVSVKVTIPLEDIHLSATLENIEDNVDNDDGDDINGDVRYRVGWILW